MDAAIGELQKGNLSWAMYTNPAFVRRGVGRLILLLCEQAAVAEGFMRLASHRFVRGETCPVRP